MMCASFRNLPRLVAYACAAVRQHWLAIPRVPSGAASWVPLWVLARAHSWACLLTLLALGLVLTSAPAWAASSSTAPHTGMEGGSRHTYGPEGEGRKDKRIPTGGSPVDAYGNAIMTEEEMEEAPRQRPRPGAYGVRPTPPPSRPLPDLPTEAKDSGWKFR